MFFGQRAEVFVTEVTELLTVSGFGYRDQCRSFKHFDNRLEKSQYSLIPAS